MPLTKERMREYQRERRSRLRLVDGGPVQYRKITLSRPILDIEKLRLWRRDSIPLRADTPCIYFLFSGDEIVYVGQSNALAQRIMSHQNGTADTEKKDFDSLVVVGSTKERIRDEELAYIRQFTPRYNKAGNNHVDEKKVPCQRCAELWEQIQKRDSQIKELVKGDLEDFKYQMLKKRYDVLEKETRELRAYKADRQKNSSFKGF
jgi:predicted GIY-YIG superfamily endonuclease